SPTRCTHLCLNQFRVPKLRKTGRPDSERNLIRSAMIPFGIPRGPKMRCVHLVGSSPAMTATEWWRLTDHHGHLRGGRGVAAALGGDAAVDHDHADAGNVAELHALQQGLAGGVLGAVEEHEV